MSHHGNKAQQLIDAVDRIAIRLGAEAEAIHTTARIPSETIREMRDAGVFRLLQPARFDGLELDFATFFDVQRRLARECMSAGWLSGILGLQAWQLALFPPQAQEDVWGDNADSLISSAFMPSGRVQAEGEGFVLSGRWHYSSGSPHSDWVLLGGMANAPSAPPDYRAFLLPRKDYHLVLDWNTVGMRGTESHGIEVKEAFVPGYRTFSTADGFRCICPGHALHDNPLYRVPFGQLFALSIALPAIGALERAVEEVLELVGPQASAPAGAARQPAVHLAVAAAAAAAQESRATAQRTIDRLTECAARRTTPPLQERAAMRLDAARISDKAVRGIDGLFHGYGSRSLFASTGLARAWLDINAASLHAGNNVDRYAGQYACALTGGEVRDPLL